MLNRGSLGKIDIPRPDTGVISVVILDARGSVQTGDWITLLLILVLFYQVSLLPVSLSWASGNSISYPMI
jgi:hypothetical protein